MKLTTELDSLQANANALRAAVKTERCSAEPVVVALGNLSRRGYSDYLDPNGLPLLGSDGRMQAAHVPSEYFTRVTDELDARATEYKTEIDEIAEFLKAQGIVLSCGNTGFGTGNGVSLLGNLSQRYTDIGLSSTDGTPFSRGKTIEDIIRRQYEYFMVVASHIANVHENLRSLKERFLQVLRDQDSDVFDPFQQADLREKAEKDRQRILADKRAADGALLFANDVSSLAQTSALAVRASTGSILGTTNSLALGGTLAKPSAGLTSGGLFGDSSKFNQTLGTEGFDNDPKRQSSRRKRQ